MRELESQAHSRHDRASPATPRLGLLRLLLWTACSGACLALLRAVNTLPDNFSAEVSQAMRLGEGLQSIIVGAAWTGAGVLIWSRARQGPPMLTHPGHWLLVVSLLTWTARLLFEGFIPMGIGSHTVFAILGAVYFSQTLLFVAAAWWNAGRIWKGIFVGLAVCHLGVVLFLLVRTVLEEPLVGPDVTVKQIGSLIASGSAMLSSVLTVTISIYSLVELGTGLRRDWLHWTGVVTYVAPQVVGFAVSLFI